MKPVHLGWIDPAESGIPARKFKVIAKTMQEWLGEVEEHEPEDETTSLLKTFAERHQLAYRKAEKFFVSDSLFSCRGSVSYHSDKGLGLVLTWIVHECELKHHETSRTSQLVTRDGCIDVGLGDVFLFNADAGHCWVSNRATVFAQIAVKRLPSFLK